MSTVSLLVLCFLLFAGCISLTRPSWLGGRTFSQLVWSRSRDWLILIPIAVITAALWFQFWDLNQGGDAVVFGLWSFVLGHWFWRD